MSGAPVAAHRAGGGAARCHERGSRLPRTWQDSAQVPHLRYVGTLRSADSPRPGSGYGAGMGSARIAVRDCAIALGVAAILLVTGVSEHHGSTGPELLGYALLAVGGLALVARRRAPVTVLIVTGLSAVGYQAAGFTAFAVAYLVAVYASMRAGRHAATVATSVVLLVAAAGRGDDLGTVCHRRGVHRSQRRSPAGLADRGRGRG